MSTIEIAIYVTTFLAPFVGWLLYFLLTAPARRAAEEARIEAEKKAADADAHAKALARRAKQRPWENIEVPKTNLAQASGHAPPAETPKPPILVLLLVSCLLTGLAWSFVQWKGDAYNIRGTAISPSTWPPPGLKRQ